MSNIFSDFSEMIEKMDKITHKHRDVHLAVYQEFLNSNTIKVIYDYSRTFIKFYGTDYGMIISNTKDNNYCDITITYEDKPINIKNLSNTKYSIHSFEELKKKIYYIDSNKKYLLKN
jgi:hypothetical protein